MSAGTQPYVVTFARASGAIGQVVLAAPGMFAARARAREIAAAMADLPTRPDTITPLQLADTNGEVLWASNPAWAATPCAVPVAFHSTTVGAKNDDDRNP